MKKKLNNNKLPCTTKLRIQKKYYRKFVWQMKVNTKYIQLSYCMILQSKGHICRVRPYYAHDLMTFCVKFISIFHLLTSGSCCSNNWNVSYIYYDTVLLNFRHIFYSCQRIIFNVYFIQNYFRKVFILTRTP